MICLLALIVFSVLGIFSLSYRRLAKEAFDCVFRRLTFRPCRTNLKQRLKSKLTAKFLKTNPALGRFTFRYF
jgi:hypothetical protein